MSRKLKSIKLIRRVSSHGRVRRGAVSVLWLLLLIPLIAFTAFCVDVGWITTTKSELQNVADASASAGARQLVDFYDEYLLADESQRKDVIVKAKNKATDYCLQFGALNSAGGADSIAIAKSDVQFGFIDSEGVYQTDYSGFPNTVQVVARRDDAVNGRLPLFFAPVIEMRDVALNATSSSTVYSGKIASFSSDGDGGWADDWGGYGECYESLLLPVAFDVNHWNRFFDSGLSPDGEVHLDAEGNQQIQIYPSPHNAPGNFGLLCIGAYTNSEKQYSQWVLEGPSPDDLQFLADNGCFPVGEDEPKAWKGSPGLRSALSKDFSEIRGLPRILPLFRPASLDPYQAASGAGSNASYDIVGFVGVVVTEVHGRGGNLSISVKPCDVIDPTAVYDPESICPLGTESTKKFRTFTHPALKFTR